MMRDAPSRGKRHATCGRAVVRQPPKDGRPIPARVLWICEAAQRREFSGAENSG
jgi:hypothetical protein